MSSDRPIRAALVGAGYIADYHQMALTALPNVEVRAVCDLNQGRADRFAAKHGLPAAYADIGEMLAKEDLDAVHVLTPPQVHVGPGKQILEAGVDCLLEKPYAHTTAGCDELHAAAQASGRSLGVSHNFLFFEAYERLARDVKGGALGLVDQVDVVWNKELGQLKGGPFGAWMLQHPENILFEVAPHSFAHVAHLVGALTDVSVDAKDEVALPRGLRFYRRWEIRGWAGTTSVRIRFSFVEGFPEHYVHVRGTNGVGRVDFENNTYARHEHTPQLLDIDRFVNVNRTAANTAIQATETLAGVVLAKAGIKKVDGPFAISIARAVQRFYETRGGGLDERLDHEVGRGAIALAETIAAKANLPAPEGEAPVEVTSGDGLNPEVLVIGGTGFIGKALVTKLREAGHEVRVMARAPRNAPKELQAPGVQVVPGDFTKPETIGPALEGIKYVYHLARGTGNTWAEYEKYDVAPTKKLAEMCADARVERFFYASSIAIYDAGSPSKTITEETRPVEAMLRANPYAKSKAENERILLELQAQRGLPVVLLRPGVVLGRGTNPYHWGVCAWPYHSVCRLWGDGNHPLPIVLVDDCAEAMVLCLEKAKVGESYNIVAAPGTVTANEYLDELESRANVKLRRVPTSGTQWYVEAMAKYALKSLSPRSTAPLPSYADWNGRSFASPFDATKAERELGWTPKKSREELIREGIHAPVDDYFGLS